MKDLELRQEIRAVNEMHKARDYNDNSFFADPGFFRNRLMKMATEKVLDAYHSGKVVILEDNAGYHFFQLV